ncbi:glucose 1-dehydrogenase [Lactococcus sp.]|uniref:glucose 1-dehydrogenase n=1 Tax=Lactococcus sp. TaxID=44273 RepID=UPI0035B27E4A
MRLENKVAVITGGASGIGRAVAERFIKEGAKVVIADINEERLAETAKEIRETGGTIETIRTDVRSEEDNKQMIKFAIEKFGQLDILFCNAGIIDGFRTVGNMTNEIWDRTFDINVKGPMMQMREAINFYLENGGGNIIVTASAAGIGGARSGAGYTASKHAVIGLAQNAAYTYADRNIRVNVIAPGGVESNIMETSANIDQEGSKIFQKGMVVMPRLGKPDEFSEVAVFLANDESSFVNGAVIPVDGGWTAY